MTTVNTPKPTPREALSHLCWALTHGENADEDIRVLSAALERLEWLRKQAEVFQDCNTGLARERDTLRAENARLREALADMLTLVVPITSAEERQRILAARALLERAP